MGDGSAKDGAHEPARRATARQPGPVSDVVQPEPLFWIQFRAHEFPLVGAWDVNHGRLGQAEGGEKPRSSTRLLGFCWQTPAPSVHAHGITCTTRGATMPLDLCAGQKRR